MDGDYTMFQCVFGFLGTVFGFFLVLSTLLLSDDVAGNRYILIGLNLTNSYVTLWYAVGMPPPLRKMEMLGTHALIGSYMTGLYAAYLLFCTTMQDKIVMMFSTCWVSTLIFVLYFWLSMHYHRNQLLNGIVLTAVSILVYASYLTHMVLNMTVNTENDDVMTTVLSPLIFLYGTSWFAFGLLYNDPFIAISNGFGCGVGVVLLILQIVVYRKNNISAAHAASPKMEIKELESLEP